MKWSKQLPTKPGWYWQGYENLDGTVRNDGILKVYEWDDDKLRVEESNDHTCPISDYEGYLFSGPIGEPDGIEVPA